uniref:Uncharacterized protein n=1 Tax=Solanum lycopersicum TaxID=4081 RepID=A0A3Q7I0P0_SOLLC
MNMSKCIQYKCIPIKFERFYCKKYKCIPVYYIYEQRYPIQMYVNLLYKY